MRLISRELLMKYADRRGPVAGFTTYVSNDKPVLMHCFGWEDYSDAYDDFAVQLSEDNGRTWSEPEICWTSTVGPEGKIRYAEPAPFWDADRQQLVVLTDKVLHPNDKLNVDAEYALALDIYDGKRRAWLDRQELAFPGQRCPAVSFSFPIKTARGRLIVPGQTHLLDEDGKPVHYKGCWSPAGVIVNLLGDYREDGSIAWSLSRPVIPDLERSSRGLYEPAVAELAGGRLAMILRGDNSMFPDKPGYKWLCFSSDQGETWSVPTPMPAADGSHPESPGAGSALFRSIADGKLYWIGNLCLRGERPCGGLPRTPLYVMEVQEEPFAFKTETAFAIDEKSYNDSPDVQFSNFRFYQDRQTGELVLYMVRFCERGTSEIWKSDYYRYRIELSE